MLLYVRKLKEKNCPGNIQDFKIAAVFLLLLLLFLKFISYLLLAIIIF